MKKIINGLTIASVLICGMILGGALAKAPQKELVEVTRVITQSEEGIYIGEGQQYIEFNDGSYGIVGNGEYVFQPVNLGDWNYELENKEDLEKVIKTYMSIKNSGTF